MFSRHKSTSQGLKGFHHRFDTLPYSRSHITLQEEVPRILLITITKRTEMARFDSPMVKVTVVDNGPMYQSVLKAT